ncbi:MAG TPA: septation protein A [Steroidobacteraceae bacterium]|nr:septation protein A [Steroidobacteraceae bacterium]
MQLLFDFLPILLFFVAYKLEGIYVATGVLIVAVLAQTLVSWIRHRKVSAMLLTSAVLVLVFGGLTLLVHDAVFIKWKPTIVNWLFAAAFLASQFMKGPTIVQRLMGEKMVLEAPLWTRLNLMWVAFFVVVGALNLYVAFNFSESTWVNFKLFGLMGLTLVFALAQGLWLARKSEQVAADATPRAE